jgi:energy-coupling factor transporter ATP-binding protein EcfA2
MLYCVAGHPRNFPGLEAVCQPRSRRAPRGPEWIRLTSALPRPRKARRKTVVRTPEHPDHRPLERLSAGQRSTAILLLALLESHGPLILDQPEDDLDNRFIYESVVRRLRDTKETRQFIIATHNANIPVLGDAEQILILAAEQDGDRFRARVERRGSIDNEDLHGPLEDVLEGGREAFQRRKEKYGF